MRKKEIKTKMKNKEEKVIKQIKRETKSPP
jgi:hypothetical protein